MHGPYAQSERAGLYSAALKTLQELGKVFPCVCSRREVEAAAVKRDRREGDEVVYPGTCRGRDAGEVIERARELGRAVAWRFRCDESDQQEVFVDRVVGERRERAGEAAGDFVVFRGETAAYQLAVVVDDITQEVTEVVRGEDLLGSTARQLAVYRALGAAAPTWAHLPLVYGKNREKMAKRAGSMSLARLRESGASAERVREEILRSLGVKRAGLTVREAAKEWAVEVLREPSRGRWIWTGRGLDYVGE